VTVVTVTAVTVSQIRSRIMEEPNEKIEPTELEKNSRHG
jgi:hypothetical protein